MCGVGPPEVRALAGQTHGSGGRSPTAAALICPVTTGPQGRRCDNRASGSAPDKGSSVNPRDPANISYRLGVLAYNLGNLWRRLVLPERIGSWSLTSLQQRLVKTGGRLVRHARYYWLLLAESHLTKGLFGAMLRRIWALPMPTG